MTSSKADLLEVGAALRLLAGRLNRRLRQNTDVPVGVTALSALSAVLSRGPLTVGQLAERERVRPPTMTSMVAGLEARGLLTRRSDDSDRRLSWLECTEQGRDLVLASRTQGNLYLSRLLIRLTPLELDAVRTAVTALSRLLESEV